MRAPILDPAVSWPWSSGDKRIADQGVIGDARSGDRRARQRHRARVVEGAGAVLKQLRENQG